MLDGTFSTGQLAEAAAAATCMTEFLVLLAIPATDASRKRMSARLERLGVCTSHWQHSPSVLYTRDDLVAAVRASTSFAGVLRYLGRPQAGGTQSYLARRIRAEGIDVSHFTGSAHNKGVSFPS
jgi:hypothetical protein